jgi:ATP-dependent 26S proteasome regulatory subunit
MKTNKTFDSIILNLEESIKDDIYNFLNRRKWYDEMGVSYKRGYLLHGNPGTGKTSVILAIANLAKYDIYQMDLSKFNSINDLDEAFEKLPSDCCVVLEDIDCMISSVNSRSGIDKGDKESENKKSKTKEYIPLNAILNYLDGVYNNDGRIYILTTNYIERLDKALIRPGRMDRTFHLTNCTHVQIINLFKFYYKDLSEHLLASFNIELKQHKENLISPSFVVSIFQQYLDDPIQAKKKLLTKIPKS